MGISSFRNKISKYCTNYLPNLHDYKGLTQVAPIVTFYCSSSTSRWWCSQLWWPRRASLLLPLRPPLGWGGRLAVALSWLCSWERCQRESLKWLCVCVCVCGGGGGGGGGYVKLCTQEHYYKDILTHWMSCFRLHTLVFRCQPRCSSALHCTSHQNLVDSS